MSERKEFDWSKIQREVDETGRLYCLREVVSLISKSIRVGEGRYVVEFEFEVEVGELGEK